MKPESGQKALGLACRFQNEVCDLEEIIELFCLDAEAAQQAIEAAVLAEREACALVCESRTGMRGTGAWTVLMAASDAILARTQPMRIEDARKEETK